MDVFSLPSAPPVLPGARTGEQILREWPSLPERARRRLAVAAGRALAPRLQDGRAPTANLSDFRFTPQGAGWRAEAWPPPSAPAHGFPVVGLLAWLSREADRRLPPLDEAAATLFLRQVLRAAGCPRGSRDYYAFRLRREVIATRHRRAAGLAAAARRELQALGAGRRGARTEAPHAPSPEDLEALLAAALATPACVLLKQSPEAQVYRWDRPEGPLLVKVYPAARRLDRLKDAVRPPRALRAWVAARVFAELGLPAPRPLTVLLGARVGGRRSHLFVSEFISGACTARDWIKPRLHRLPPGPRRAVARQVLDMFARLEWQGILHGDTKAANLLVRPGTDGLATRHWWIDLESVRFDTPPTPRLLLRNLIQLNGSIGRRLLREDRLAFLGEFARTHPWARAPEVAEQIERVTGLRLRRELRGECGS
jgi:tRNA A-37 threonylcarbamoyl transferase component Bud32